MAKKQETIQVDDGADLVITSPAKPIRIDDWTRIKKSLKKHPRESNIWLWGSGLLIGIAFSTGLSIYPIQVLPQTPGWLLGVYIGVTLGFFITGLICLCVHTKDKNQSQQYLNDIIADMDSIKFPLECSDKKGDNK